MKRQYRWGASEKANWARNKKYGLNAELFDIKQIEQFRACAICRKPFGDVTPHVDHDHKSGRVRGLLCKQCNLMIGFAKEDPATLKMACEYLEHYRRKHVFT